MNFCRSEVKKKKWAGTFQSKSCPRSGSCPSRMRLVLLPLVLCSLFATGRALKLTKLYVPKVVDPRSEKVELRCEYNLESKELYSVKWYKDTNEFFRYMPDLTPPRQEFETPGINVNLGMSDAQRVTLIGQSKNRRDKINLEGLYGCEVVTEGPNFQTVFAEANMSVAVLPKRAPVLDGLRPYYEIGEVLQVECTSAPSYPAANLTFLINDKEVPKSQTRHLPDDSQIVGSVVSTTRLGLTLRLERQHFVAGSLLVTCQSNLIGISAAKLLKSEATATLAASNQRLAQEPPKSSATTRAGQLMLLYLASSCLVILGPF